MRKSNSCYDDRIYATLSLTSLFDRDAKVICFCCLLFFRLSCCSFEITDRKLKGAKAAFNASIDVGITFFDTAEVYGAGVGRIS